MSVHYLERLDALNHALDRNSIGRSDLLDPIDDAELAERGRVLRTRKRSIDKAIRARHEPEAMVPRRSMGPFGGALQGRRINPDSYPKNVRTR